MEEEMNVSLKWGGHQDTLISVFGTLLHNERLVDCTISAEGQYFKAHKVILSACSSYFETLFSQHYEKHPIVILPDVKFKVLKEVMEFMYSGEVSVPENKIGAFIKLADILQVKGLYHRDYISNGELTLNKRNTSAILTEQSVVQQQLESNAKILGERFDLNMQLVDSPSQKDGDTGVPSIAAATDKCKNNYVHTLCGEKLFYKTAVQNGKETSEVFRYDQSQLVSQELPSANNFLTETYDNRAYSDDTKSNLFCSADEHCKSYLLTADSSSRRYSSSEVLQSAHQQTTAQKPVVEELSAIKYEHPINDVINDSLEQITQDDNDCDSESIHKLNEMEGGDYTYHSNCPNRHRDRNFTSVLKRAPDVLCPYKCSVCGKCYKYRSCLYRHVKYECGQEPFFKCAVCSARYTQKHALKDHIYRFHCSR